MKLRKIISGGQTGADIAGLKAARYRGLETGGYIPKGCLTQIGPMPDLVTLFNCVEHSSPKYPPRTFANVKDSDGTVRFANNFNSPGEKLTWKAILQYQRPWFDIHVSHIRVSNLFNIKLGLSIPSIEMMVKEFRMWLRKHKIEVLNVAGNSERTCTGIEKVVFDFMVKALKKRRG